MPQRDHVHRVLEQWRREAPELDRSPFGVLGRISRLAHLLQAEIEPIFAAHGVTGGEFDVLAALRRAGRPYRLSPTELSRALIVTSGGMTKRLNALEDRGLIRRRIRPERWTVLTRTVDLRREAPSGGDPPRTCRQRASASRRTEREGTPRPRQLAGGSGRVPGRPRRPPHARHSTGTPTATWIAKPRGRSCPSGMSAVHEVVEDDESGWRDGNAGTVDLHEDVGLCER